MLTVNAAVQLENNDRATEEERSYGEEVAKEDKEPEEEVVDEEEEGGVSEEEEAKEATEREEEEDEEEMMEEPLTSAAPSVPPADGEEIETSSAQQEEDEVKGQPSQHLFADNDAASAEPANQAPDVPGEASRWMCEEEEVEEEQEEEQLVREEEGEVGWLGEEEIEREEPKCDVATEMSDVAIRPPSLNLLESNQELPSEVGGATSPSKTRTATLHINLISPSSEKSGAFFQQSPTTAHPAEKEEQVETSGGGEGEGEGGGEGGEKEKHADVEEEGAAGLEGVAEQQMSDPSQSKVRFTIAPAWQRSLSAEGETKEGLTPPGGAEEEELKEEATATVQHDTNTDAEGGADVELEGSVPGGPLSGVMSQPPPTEAPPPVTAATEGTPGLLVSL